MRNFNKRLDKLIKIYNIPLENKWENCFEKENYTVYTYWKNLGLLDAQELNEINLGGELKRNKHITSFFKSLDYHFNTKYYINGEVADIGSGFGFVTFWLAISGASRVYVIGDKERVNFIERLYNEAISLELVEAGKLCFVPRFVQVGDSSLAPQIKENSLAMILLNDTLEHISPRIFPSLVRSSYNGLEEGGYFVSRQQNTDSAKTMAALLQYWNQQEKSIHEPNRRKLIEDNIAKISKNNVNKLTKYTRGLDSVDFYAAIEEYKLNSAYPNYNPNSPSIDILTDVPDEGDTSINRILSEFRKYNFRKYSVYPDLLSSRRSKYAQPFARILPNLFFSKDLFAGTSVFLIKK